MEFFKRGKIMKVWTFLIENGYEWLEPIKEMTFEESHSYDGRSKIKDWQPFAVRPVEQQLFGDFTNVMFTTIGVNKRAVEVLSDLIEGQVEFLPLIAADEEWYLLYTTNVVDAVDFSKSDVTFFPNSQRIMCIDKPVFFEKQLKGNHIFKIPQLKLSSLFVSDEFRQRVMEAGLMGIKFELVWDSEAE